MEGRQDSGDACTSQRCQNRRCAKSWLAQRLSADGIIHVKQPGSEQPYPARLQTILDALRALHDSNALYTVVQSVSNVITDLEAKLPAA